MNKLLFISVLALLFTFSVDGQNKSAKGKQRNKRSTSKGISGTGQKKTKTKSISGQKPFSNPKFRSKRPSYTSPKSRSYGDVKIKPIRSATRNPFRGKSFNNTKVVSGSSIPSSGKNFNPASTSQSRNPFRGRSFNVRPSFTPGKLYSNKRHNVNPSFSSGNPFRGMSFRANPSFSPSKPFSNKYFKVKPRFSPSNPFRGMSFKVNPRFSPSKPFSNKYYKVNPRFSPSNPFRGMSFKVNPRYTNLSFKEKFYVNKHLKGQLRPVNWTSEYTGGYRTKRTKPEKIKPENWASRYTGGYRTKKTKPGKLKPENWVGEYTGGYKLKYHRLGEPHASWRYRRANKFQNSFIRNFVRYYDKKVAKANGNKSLSKQGSKKVKKAKFDRKERTIWNN